MRKILVIASYFFFSFNLIASGHRCVKERLLKNKTRIIPVEAKVITNYLKTNIKHITKIQEEVNKEKLNKLIADIYDKKYEVYITLRQNYEQISQDSSREGIFHGADFLEINVYESKDCKQVYENLKIAQYFNPEILGVTESFFETYPNEDSLFRKPFVTSIFDISHHVKNFKQLGFHKIKGKSLFMIIRSTRPFFSRFNSRPDESLQSNFQYIGEYVHFVSKDNVITGKSFNRAGYFCSHSCVGLIFENQPFPYELTFENSMSWTFDINATVKVRFDRGSLLNIIKKPLFLMGSNYKFQKNIILNRLRKTNKVFFDDLIKKNNLIY